MKRILLLVKKNKNRRIQLPLANLPVLDSLPKQVKSLGLDISINLIDLNEIPAKTDADLVGFLDENLLIPPDYLYRVLSVYNLNKDAGVFCGPVVPVYSGIPTDKTLYQAIQFYKKFVLSIPDEILSVKIKDNSSFPYLNGCFFSGYQYNNFCGYSVINSPRGIIENNPNIFKSMLNNKIDLIYHKSLEINYVVSDKEIEIDNLSIQYYNLGYLDCVLNQKNNVKIDDSNISSIFECMYNLGYHEAKIGYKLV